MENRTYFSEIASVEPHFIVAGHTDDLCCNDALQITSLEYELHRHLKEQGFEAVVFYNILQNIYCYDRESYNIVFGKHTVQSNRAEHNGASDGINLTEDGPLGVEWDLFDDANTGSENEPTVDSTTGALCNRTLALPAVWSHVTKMLMGDKKTAFVLSNMNAETEDRFTPEALRTLVELAEYSSRNHSIAVYIYRGFDFASLQSQSEDGGEAWQRFMNACIRPLICRANEHGAKSVRHHVLRVGYPNSAEIRNLLNHLRLRTSKPLYMKGGDVEAVALKFAYFCSSESIVLKDLLSRIEAYLESRPTAYVTPENCHEVLGKRNSNTAMDDMRELIGLDDVKQNLESIFKLAKKEGFKEAGIPKYSSRLTPVNRGVTLSHGLNVCLLGEPGTGKTEVAELLGRIYYEAGVLPTAHVETVKPSDIIEGQYGSSGRNMSDRVQRALGGVLFIDEAYGLSKEEGGGAGVEAITQLVGDMTAYRGRFAVVLAGYEKKIRKLLDENDGLKSRFSERNFYYLQPYSWQEIRDILLLKARKDSSDIIIEENDGEKWLDNFCENWVGDRGKNWGNGREAEKLLFEMKQRCAFRTGNDSSVEVGRYRLLPCDIPERWQVHLNPRSKDLDEALKKMEDLIGLSTAKRYLRNLCATIRWDQGTSEPGNYLFVGPPGTGKTFFAEHMAEIFHHMHILRRRTPIICNAGDLRNGVHGTIEEVVENARGGMLFIDEAHQLADTPEGVKIIRDLVPIIENPEIRADTCFVLAGYQHEMIHLLSVDSGLASRFPSKNHIRFVNYKASELTDILEVFAKARGYIPQPEYLRRTRIAMNGYLDTVNERFGNARYMRNEYLEMSIARRTKRLNKEHLTELSEADREYAVPSEEKVMEVKNANYLEAMDIPEDKEGFAGPIGMPDIDETTMDSRIASLVGKSNVKEYIEVCRNKSSTPEFFDAGLTNGMHFVITGPYGSGRHTVARILAGMLYEAGKLDNERPKSYSKGDFEGEFVGHTVPKTQNVINGAVGSMMIVENPSAMLARNGSDNTFGTEALATLVGAMGSSQDLSMVFIDTAEGMEAVVKSVSGLREKATFFELDDLSPEEMQKIFEQETKYSFSFDEEMKELLPSFFVNWVSSKGGLGEKTGAWANGGEIASLVDTVRTNWSKLNGKKVVNDIGIPLREITKEMFPEGLKKYLVSTKVSHETALEELNAMTGLAEVKKAIGKIRRRLSRADKNCTIPGCYCFVGNPGTGKTTVARMMGGVLVATGVLKQGHVIERTASKFAENPDLFDEALKLAKDGILFIDEAHQMVSSPGGQEVIRRLVYALEDVNILKTTTIILAGYLQEMNNLLAFDKGLKRRFGNESSIIHFEDYSPDELCQIMREMASKAGDNPNIGSPCNLELTEEYCDASHRIFEMICDKKDPGFGNAGFVRSYLNDSVDRLLEREESTETVEYVLTAEDIPERFEKTLREFNEKSQREKLPARIVEAAINIGAVEDVTEKTMREYTKTVTVYLVAYKDGQKAGSGSGVIFTETGHVLTCAHVVSDA
ncbi:MAG: AAA family ATPase, partial [Clostridia bacterium]|nr:AAA family ATPase [Clostridia bacterium]